LIFINERRRSPHMMQRDPADQHRDAPVAKTLHDWISSDVQPLRQQPVRWLSEQYFFAIQSARA
jgi:hypothetical protein